MPTKAISTRKLTENNAYTTTLQPTTSEHKNPLVSGGWEEWHRWCWLGTTLQTPVWSPPQSMAKRCELRAMQRWLKARVGRSRAQNDWDLRLHGRATGSVRRRDWRTVRQSDNVNDGGATNTSNGRATVQTEVENEEVKVTRKQKKMEWREAEVMIYFKIKHIYYIGSHI